MRVRAPPLVSTNPKEASQAGPQLTHEAFQQLHIQLPEDLTDQRTYLGPHHKYDQSGIGRN